MNEVTVTDIKMPFWSMVALLLKIAVAAIPAMIILAAAAFGALVVIAFLLAAAGVAFPKGGL